MSASTDDPGVPGGWAAGRARFGGLLADIDLVIFDKDGTLIDFRLMWGDWVAALAAQLTAAHGAPLEKVVFSMMGVDRATGLIQPHAAIAATPMQRLRTALVKTLAKHGVAADEAERIVGEAWHSPDPVMLARPLADLPALFGGLRTRGIRVAIATSDDREPTERTLEHLGVEGLVEALAAADDGRPVKPNPDAVLWICRSLDVPVERTAVIGDAPADVAMGRAAGAGLVIGVLTGVGDRAALNPYADAVIDSIADLVPTM
jgi:phosphoglycolate phosphatase-like HAD superfamily hydrolase